MAVPPETAASIFNLQARRAQLASLAILMALLTTVPAAPAQTFRVLHTFTGGSDGATPLTGLTIDQAGNLYGTTAYGGTGACSFQQPSGCGTVFRMTLKNSAWIFFPTYSFGGWTVGDGMFPMGRVVFGPDGRLYGTTPEGGTRANCSHGSLIGCGTVFSLRPQATPPPTPFKPWQETVVYRFQSVPDGAAPVGEIAFDRNGNLYGATETGGSGGGGSVYELLPSQNWSKSILYSTADVNEIRSGVTLDSRGNVYATTYEGGPQDDGSVFEVTRTGSGWIGSVLHSFSGNDGLGVTAGVILDPSGNLYGATINGSPDGNAYVYELSPSAGGWTYTSLYGIAQSYGGGPAANLVMDAAGNLYGTTVGDYYTQNPYGSVFKLSSSNGVWQYTELHRFTGGADGGTPHSNVVIDTAGNLYGTASAGGSGCNGTGCGVVWEITP